MKRKSIISISICLGLFVAACNNPKNTEKTETTDSNTTSATVTTVTDSTVMKRDEVVKMLKAIEDSISALKAENEKLRTHPPKHPDVTFPAGSTSYMEAIKWMWNNPNPPAQMRCLGYTIIGDGPVKFRTNATAHDCVVNAIQAYRQDRLEGAINWLCAGQCHNDAAQQDIRNNGQMAAQWALQTYGQFVPE